MPARRKTTTIQEEITTTQATTTSTIDPEIHVPISTLETVLSDLSSCKAKLEKLQNEIEETKNSWIKEQHDHETQIQERTREEEVARKRDQETYEYEIRLVHKKAGDEFTEKKEQWEKELAARKEEIDKDKQELIQLRKIADGFPDEKDRMIKEATNALQKTLAEQFDQERKLREQEVKSEKEILVLKINTLTAENSRLAKEIEILKKQLDEATRQLKDIAVQVIHSNRPFEQKSPSPES